MPRFQYKGFFGTIEPDLENNIFYGKLFGISDLVTYEASTLTELEKEFKTSVDLYLQACKEDEKEPAIFDVLDYLDDAEDIKLYFDEYLKTLEEDATSVIEFDTDLMMKDVLIEFNAHTMALIFQKSRSLTDDSHAEEKNTLDCLFSALNRLRDFLYATDHHHINKDAVIRINRTARALTDE